MKLRMILFVVVIMLVFAVPVFAQTGGAAAPNGNWWASGIGLGIAVGLAGMGQAKVAAAACEGIARNPGARDGVQLAMIFGLAFIESLVLFIWVLLFLRAN